jgi:hypothetical protein
MEQKEYKTELFSLLWSNKEGAERKEKKKARNRFIDFIVNDLKPSQLL